MQFDICIYIYKISVFCLFIVTLSEHIHRLVTEISHSHNLSQLVFLVALF